MGKYNFEKVIQEYLEYTAAYDNCEYKWDGDIYIDYSGD